MYPYRTLRLSFSEERFGNEISQKIEDCVLGHIQDVYFCLLVYVDFLLKRFHGSKLNVINVKIPF